MNKWTCEECDWCGFEPDLLTAPSPFDARETLNGCPDCKSCNRVALVCDEPNCWNAVTCGWPSPNGYRHTCGDHAQWANDQRHELSG